MSFADTLRAAMQKAGVSQSELARRLGIRSQAVNQWLAPNGTAPRGARLMKVAAFLGVSLAELLEEYDEISTADPLRVELLARYEIMTEEQRQALLTIAKVITPVEKPDAPAPRPAGNGAAAAPFSGKPHEKSH